MIFHVENSLDPPSPSFKGRRRITRSSSDFGGGSASENKVGRCDFAFRETKGGSERKWNVHAELWKSQRREASERLRAVATPQCGRDDENAGTPSCAV